MENCICPASPSSSPGSTPRHLWILEEVMQLFELPFGDLLAQAHAIFAHFFDTNEIQVSTLLNIKTGGCPENCSYCPQSAHYTTGLEKEALMTIGEVTEAAKRAKAAGATRFCMGAAWRGPRDEDLDKVIDMIKATKSLGLETCVTLGLLKKHQAKRLKQAGLDFYNHNIDTSEEYYDKIITTRTFQDRMETLQNVQEAGLHTCCGGILGMGESVEDRGRMLMILANLPEPPRSVPINQLIPIPGTPLENASPVDPLDFVRTIAVARIMMPLAFIRLSAGRNAMSDEMQALCFFAGANSIFYGDKLLTASNPIPDEDIRLFKRLGLRMMPFLGSAS